ncbi:MAG: hypothetical protein AB7K09_21345, partial [Planctomycetota bacterium]
MRNVPTFCLLAVAALMLLPAAAFAEGFDSPEAAADAFFKALRAHDLKAIGECTPPDHRNQLDDPEFTSVFNALDAGEHKLVQSLRANDHAIVQYTCQFTFNTEKFLAASLKLAEARMRENGLDGEALEAALAEARLDLESNASSISSQFSSDNVAFQFSTEDGRWYVNQIVSGDEVEPALADFAIRIVVERGMQAAKNQDVNAFRDLMHETAIEDFLRTGGPGMIKATTITAWSLEYIDRWGDSSGKAVLSMTATFDRTIATAMFEAMIREQLQQTGLSADDIAAQIAQQAETIANGVEQAASVVEAGRIEIHVATDSDGLWRIVGFRPVDDGTDTTPPDQWDPRNEEVQRTAGMLLNAIQHHNEDRLVALVQPAMRQRFKDEGHLALALATNVEQFHLIDSHITTDEQGVATATCECYWVATFDPARYVELGLATMREFLTDRGLPPAQIDEALKQAAEALAARGEELTRETSSEYQTITLVEDGGCWYVHEINPSADQRKQLYGAETAEEAIKTLIGALSASDFETASNMLAPATMNDSADLLIGVITGVDSVTFGDVDNGEAGTETHHIVLQATLDADEWASRWAQHDVELMRLNGASDEAVAAKQPEIEARWAKTA